MVSGDSMDEHISIKEFAKRAQVSPQAIYQRLDKDLVNFVKVVDGKKSLDTKALELFRLKENETSGLSVIQETLKILNNQLLEKDKQISDLISDKEFLKQQLTAAQALHAGTMQTKLIEAVEPDKPKKSFWKNLLKRD